MKKNQQTKTKKQNLLNSKWLVGLLAALFIYLMHIGLKESLIFKKKDRLNIVVYGENTAFYSFGLNDGTNYFISFPADVKILVPGGFGYYRLGGLGKLVALGNSQEIFKRAFSSATGSFIDSYFYPTKSQVFFGEEKKVVFYPSPTDFLLLNTNVSLIDRFYILSLFLTKQKNNFKQITNLPVNKDGEDIYFDEKKFYDDQLGFFYQESLRREKAAVQLIYSVNEENALLLSKIIEGQGIRVVDITYKPGIKQCTVYENNGMELGTTESLVNILKCRKKKMKTNPYDIILELGNREKEWSL